MSQEDINQFENDTTPKVLEMDADNLMRLLAGVLASNEKAIRMAKIVVKAGTDRHLVLICNVCRQHIVHSFFCAKSGYECPNQTRIIESIH